MDAAREVEVTRRGRRRTTGGGAGSSGSSATGTAAVGGIAGVSTAGMGGTDMSFGEGGLDSAACALCMRDVSSSVVSVFKTASTTTSGWRKASPYLKLFSQSIHVG